jgi:Ca2+-binding EF-hand superfamily protein
VVRQRQATLKAIAAAGKGRGWGATLRKAKKSGVADGALRSMLSRRGAGLLEDAVAGSMLARGCTGVDALNQGLGMLADLSVTATATGEKLAESTSSQFDKAAARARGGGPARGSRGWKAAGAVVASAGRATDSAGGGPRSSRGSEDWASVRKRRETVRGGSSLTDDLRSVTGSTASGSASATASLMSSIGGALRHARGTRHRSAAVGAQAAAAAEAGGMARGRLGEWELVRLKKLFRQADADSSGSLSLAEFRGAVAEAADWGFVPGDAADDGVSPADVAAAFRMLDADGSGSVSFGEFVSVLREQARPKGPLGGAETRSKAEGMRLVFRTLSADEASSRARMHFKTASGIHSRLLRMAADDPKRARLEKQALQLSEKGSRLTALVRRLEGAADPPERPPAPPKARRDFRTFIQSVPEREARKTLVRGMRDYRVPPPGDESDSDSDDDDGKQEGEDVDDYRKTVRARKRHVVLKTTADI